MYIFLDESGVDKQKSKSSIVLVYITTDNLNILQNAVVEIEKRIGIKNFHWTYSNWKVRKVFIEEISKQDFKVKVALIQNPFYADISYEYALQHLVIEKNVVSLIIDGKKGRSYERKFKKVLRDKGISVKKLKTGNDESFPALRIADAIAGAIRFRYDNPDDSRIKNLYDKFHKKILFTLE
ncbi:DUF3800 domain-containing protein [Candidatus Nomurabacteria bacterium]|nr:DUF3800 domain-containing protein [Candidatus Nomurabacteria bacterium]